MGKGLAILFGLGDGTFEPKVDLSGGDLGEGIGQPQTSTTTARST